MAASSTTVRTLLVKWGPFRGIAAMRRTKDGMPVNLGGAY